MLDLDVPVYGAGLGLRRENSADLLRLRPAEISCLEVAPENYIYTGGLMYRQFCELAEHYPMIFHGLSFSLGSLYPLDKKYLKDLKAFLQKHRAPWMSDHLCYSSLFGVQSHDLLPLPCTRETIRHVVPRIRRIQNYLEMPFAIENISYYALSGFGDMPEWEFLAEIAERADCSLLLDVNNVYVNSVNHRFDPYEYLRHIPLERVLHVHVAGHTPYRNFLLDNHGAAVIDPVWDLLRYVVERREVPAIILERDTNIPELAELLQEVGQARRIVEHGRVLRREAGMPVAAQMTGRKERVWAEHG